MRARCNLVSVYLDFRVNEIEFRQAQLHRPGSDPACFQIVIEHPFLGAFALHEESSVNCVRTTVLVLGNWYLLSN
jgi:hypothetical protein